MDENRINKIENDVIDIKVRLGVAESDIKVIKSTLDKIDKNISKILWGVLGTFGTLMVGIILAVVNSYVSRH